MRFVLCVLLSAAAAAAQAPPSFDGEPANGSGRIGGWDVEGYVARRKEEAQGIADGLIRGRPALPIIDERASTVPGPSELCRYMPPQTPGCETPDT